MGPLIKWPGGKSKEFLYIRDLIPDYKRYIEPFFGGGAVFFRLSPKESLINDLDADLVDIYRFVKGDLDREAFKKEMNSYAENWEKIPAYIALFEDKFTRLYEKQKNGKITSTDLREQIRNYIEAEEHRFNGLFNQGFCIDDKNLLEQVITNLASKVVRTSKIEKVNGDLSLDDLHKNIETAFRSGFYMHFRDLMNWAGSNRLKLSQAKRIANFYFVREFCYGSMFRYNSRGEFNIPYGGIAYNRKNLKAKIDHVFSTPVLDLLSGADIRSGDFSSVMESGLTSEDFIFLDPPYDTEFSDYSNNAFDKRDQERLAGYLYDTSAKYILIIKNTPFIHGLYERPAIKITSFEKQYLYNVKGRNPRDAEHLIIKNF